MNKTQIEEKIKELHKNKESIESSFNNVALTMINHLATKFPSSHFGIYKTTINQVFKDKPHEPISIFVTHVYANDEYRKRIKAGDEAFFIGQTYDDTDKETTAQIFEFKELWKSFDSATKSIVKKTMLALVDRTEVFIGVLSELSSHKKLLKNAN